MSGALRLIKARGYVVVGIPPEEKIQIYKGDTFLEFANRRLADGWVLSVSRKTTRADWVAQSLVLFGPAGEQRLTPKSRGERFFRCALVNDPFAMTKNLP